MPSKQNHQKHNVFNVFGAKLSKHSVFLCFRRKTIKNTEPSLLSTNVGLMVYINNIYYMLNIFLYSYKDYLVVLDWWSPCPRASFSVVIDGCVFQSRSLFACTCCRLAIRKVSKHYIVVNSHSQHPYLRDHGAEAHGRGTEEQTGFIYQ